MKPEWQTDVIKLTNKITKFIIKEASYEKPIAQRVLTNALESSQSFTVELRAARKLVSGLKTSRTGRKS